MEKVSKVKAMLAIALIATLALLVGCGKEEIVTYNQSQVDTMIDDAVSTAVTETTVIWQGTVDEMQQQIDTLSSDVEGLASDKDELQAQLDDATADLTEYQEATAVAEEEAERLINAFVEDEISLNTPAVFDGKVLTDNKLSFLLDTEIEFDDDDYDVHEEVELNGIGIMTSSAEDGDKDFMDSPFMTIDEGDIVYRYVFDTEIDVSDITEDESLVISLAGKEIEIVNITGDKMTIRSGNEYFGKEGDEITVGDKTVELVIIGEDYVFVNVNGETEKIEEDETDTVDDLSITVLDVMEDEDGPDFATLRIGESDTSITIDKDNDDDVEDFIEDIFGESYKEDWALDWVNDTELKEISLRFIGDRTGFDEDDDDNENAMALGKGLDILGYASVAFDSITDVDYDTLTINVDMEDHELSFEWDAGFESETETADKIYWCHGEDFYEGAFYSDDDCDEDDLVGEIVELKGTDLVLDGLSFVDDDVDVSFELDEDSDSDDAVLYAYGFIVEDSESFFDDLEDEEDATLEIEVPSEKVEATIIVG